MPILRIITIDRINHIDTLRERIADGKFWIIAISTPSTSIRLYCWQIPPTFIVRHENDGSVSLDAIGKIARKIGRTLIDEAGSGFCLERLQDMLTCSLSPGNTSHPTMIHTHDLWIRSKRLVHLTIIGGYTDNHRAVAVKAIHCRSRACTTLLRLKNRQVEVTILIASPSPVDVIKTFAIASIAYELMTSV